MSNYLTIDLWRYDICVVEVTFIHVLVLNRFPALWRLVPRSLKPGYARDLPRKAYQGSILQSNSETSELSFANSTLLTNSF